MSVTFLITSVQTGNQDTDKEFVRLRGISEDGRSGVYVAFGGPARYLRSRFSELAGDDYVDEVVQRGVVLRAEGAFHASSWKDPATGAPRQGYQFRIARSELLSGPSVELFRSRYRGAIALKEARTLIEMGKPAEAAVRLDEFVSSLVGVPSLTQGFEPPIDAIEQVADPELEAARVLLPASALETLASTGATPTPTSGAIADPPVVQASKDPAPVSEEAGIAPAIVTVPSETVEPLSEADEAVAETISVVEPSQVDAEKDDSPAIETPATETQASGPVEEAPSETQSDPVVDRRVPDSLDEEDDLAPRTVVPPRLPRRPGVGAPHRRPGPAVMPRPVVHAEPDEETTATEQTPSFRP